MRMVKTRVSDVANSLLRRFWGSPIRVQSAMAFLIRFTDGACANLPIGPRGSELLCYIPPGTHWRQINYGQGEGQVEIDGREWGFYWHTASELAVVLHSGEIDPERALAFAREVGTHVTGGPDRFTLLLVGDSYASKPGP